MRPFRSNDPNPYLHQANSNTKGSGDAKVIGRLRHWTNITHSSDLYSESDSKTDSSYNLRDIRVEHGVDVDHYDRDSARELEIREDDLV